MSHILTSVLGCHVASHKRLTLDGRSVHTPLTQNFGSSYYAVSRCLTLEMTSTLFIVILRYFALITDVLCEVHYIKFLYLIIKISFQP